MNDSKWTLQELPLGIDLETKKVLKQLPSAHTALARLYGIVKTIPDPNILLNTVGLQEAKDSSAVENIITTHDELYRAGLDFGKSNFSAAKEVQNYISAMKKGFELLGKNKLITNRIILQIQEELEHNSAGFRKLPGTVLKNSQTGEVIYSPPQDYEEILRLMSNLERFINDKNICDYDPLIKMAIIHFQFESIHPFYDGNGRTGRIINILYLILEELQELPVLFLSNYIIQNKQEYYRLLQGIRDVGSWEDWLLFMIKGIEVTANETVWLISRISELMNDFKLILRKNYKFYSHELLNNLFKHPYTKIEFVVNDLKVSRITASNYLNLLAKDGILKKEVLGTGNYYVNQQLFELLAKRTFEK